MAERLEVQCQVQAGAGGCVDAEADFAEERRLEWEFAALLLAIKKKTTLNYFLKFQHLETVNIKTFGSIFKCKNPTCESPGWKPCCCAREGGAKRGWGVLKRWLVSI